MRSSKKMDYRFSLNFTIKGTEFRIYGTEIRNNKYYDLIENVRTGKLGIIECKELRKQLKDERTGEI
jgi:hypothetical protein